MIPKPESACFVIADISYTGFLAEVELEHAQDIIADVMDAMVRRLSPRWREALRILPARPAIPISISPMNSSSARARGCRASGRRIVPGYQRKGCCNE